MTNWENLWAATIVQDEPAMAKIIDRLSPTELTQLRDALAVLTTIATITYRSKMRTDQNTWL